MRLGHYFYFFFCAAAIVYVPGIAQAYDTAAVADVKSRFYHKAEGSRMGTFLLKPSLGLMQSYDDNIFRSARNEEGDFITTLRPELRLHSDWSLHQVETGASARLSRFWDNQSENSNDFAFYVSGRYDIDYGTAFTALLRHEKLHEDRSALDDPDGDAPLAFHMNTAALGFYRDLSVLKLYLDARMMDSTYEDSERNGLRLDNGNRNRQQSLLRARLAYSFTDNAQVFGQITHDRRRYDRPSTSFRDASGYDFRLGLKVNLTGKLEGEVFAGTLRQKYKGDFGTISAPSFGGSLLWNLTELTSVRAEVERRILETTLADSSGIVRTNYVLGLQHALTRDVLLDAMLGLDDDAYEGSAGSAGRDNYTLRAGFGVNYQFGNGFTTRLGYDRTQRKFDSGAQGYENNKLMASVVYAY